MTLLVVAMLTTAVSYGLTVGLSSRSVSEPEVANVLADAAALSETATAPEEGTASTPGTDSVAVASAPEAAPVTAAATPSSASRVVAAVKSAWKAATNGFKNALLAIEDILPWSPDKKHIRYLASLTNGMDATQALGQPSLTSNYSGAYYGIYISPTYNTGMAADPVNGRLFVADTNNNRVMVYPYDADWTSTYSVPTAVLGQANFNTLSPNRAGSAAANTMSSPRMVAWDASNSRLFVADSGNNRVLVFDLSSGVTVGMDASVVLGQSSMTAVAAGTGTTGMSDPEGLAWDPTNSRLFVSDYNNNRVMMFTSLTNGAAAAAFIGQPDSSTVSAGTTASKIRSPRALAWDNAGARLFVTESSNNRISVFTGAMATNMSATYVLGQSAFTNGGGSSTASTFLNPTGVAWDPDNARLYVADSDSHRVLVFGSTFSTPPTANVATYVLGQSTFTAASANRGATATAGSMSSPFSVCWTGTRLLVSDTNNGRILGFTTLANGTNATSVINQPSMTSVVSGVRGYWQSAWVNDIAVDTAGGRAFVAERTNSRVAVYALNTDGTFKTGLPYAVLGQSSFSTLMLDQAQTSLSTMYMPAGVAWDSTNSRLFVSDTGNNRVLVFNLAGGLTTGMAASAVIGQLNNYSYNPASSSATRLNSPAKIAWDNTSQRLFVADQYNNRVVVYTGTITSYMAGTYYLGQTSATGYAAGTANTNLLYPVGLTWDSVGKRLFVVENANNRVTVFNLSSGISNGMAASYVLGQSAFGVNSANGGGTVSSTGLNAPVDAAWDGNHSRLFVADYGNNRVLVYDARAAGSAATTLCPDAASTTGLANGMPASCVLGQSSFTTTGGSLTPGGMLYVNGVEYNNTSDILFAADRGYSRTLAFNLYVSPNVTPAISGTPSASPANPYPNTGHVFMTASATDVDTEAAWQIVSLQFFVDGEATPRGSCDYSASPQSSVTCSNVDVGVLTPGTHNITSKVTDGNGATATSVISVSTAATNPQVTAVSRTPSSAYSGLATTLSATAADDDAQMITSMDLKLNGSTVHTCTGSANPLTCTWNAGNVAAGSYTLTAVPHGVDGAVNSDQASPPSVTFTVAASAPTAATVSFTGNAYTGLNTSVTWSAADNTSTNGLSKVEFVVDNNDYSYATVAGATVTYSSGVHQTASGTADLGKLTAGTHHVKAVAYDAYSGVALASEAISVTVVQSVPTINSISVTTPAYVGATIPVPFSVTDNTSASGLQKVEFYTDNNDGNYVLAGTINFGAVGTLASTLHLDPMPAGPHHVYVKAYDGDLTGTTVSSTPVPFVVSTPYPDLTMVSRTPTGYQPSGGDVFAGRFMNYSFSVSSPANFKIRRIEYLPGVNAGTSSVTCDYGAEGALNPTCNSTVGPFYGATGTRTVRIRATDVYGNVNYVDDTFTAYHADPTVAGDVSIFNDNFLQQNVVYKNSSPRIISSGGDTYDNEGIASIQYAVDNQAFFEDLCTYPANTSNPPTSVACNQDLPLVEPGNHVIYIRSVDHGGGYSQVKSQALQVVETAPTFTFTRTPSGAQVGLYQIVDLTVSASDLDGDKITHVVWHVDGSATNDCVYETPAATPTCSVTNRLYTEGTHSAYVVATGEDAVTTTSQTITWVTTHRGATISGVTLSPAYPAMASNVTFSASASSTFDLVGVAQVDLWIDDVYNSSCGASGDYVVNCSKTVYIADRGWHTYQFKATDTLNKTTVSSVYSFYAAPLLAPSWRSLSAPGSQTIGTSYTTIGVNQQVSYSASAYSSSGMAEITWTVDNGVVHYCTMDAGETLGSCTLPATLYDVGDHSVSVTATSANGTTSTYVFPMLRVVHRGAVLSGLTRTPTTATTNDTNALSAFANSTLDNLTLSKLELLVDGSAVFHCDFNDVSSGSCGYDVGLLPAGSHTWQARSTDSTNYVVTSAAQAFTVYAVAPPAPAWTSTSLSPQGIIGAGEAVAFSGTATATTGLTGITWFVDDVAVPGGTCSFPSAPTSAQCEAPAAVYGVGSHDAYAVAYALNGTSTPSSPLSWTGHHDGILFSDTTATPSPSSADPVVFSTALDNTADQLGMDRVELWLDGEAVHTCNYYGEATSGTCSYDAGLLLTGTHSWQFRAFDVLGLQTVTEQVAFSVISSSGIGSGNPVSILTYGATQGGSVAGDPLTLSFTAGNQDVTAMYIYDGPTTGTPVSTCDFSSAPGNPKTCSKSYAAGVIYGTHSFSYKAVGLDASVATASQTVSMPIMPAVLSNLVPANDGTAYLYDYDTVPLTFTATSDDHTGVTRMDINVSGALYGGGTSANSYRCDFDYGTNPATCSPTPRTWPRGTYTVTFTAYKPDLTTTTVSTVTFESSVQPLEFSSFGITPTSPNATMDTPLRTVDDLVISTSVSDPNGAGVTSIGLYLDGLDASHLVKTCNFAPAVVTDATCSAYHGRLSRGDHQAYVRAYDYFGNVTSQSLAFKSGAETVANSVTLSSLSTNHTADFRLDFTLIDVDSGPLTITFPEGFTILQGASEELSTSPNSCLSNFAYGDRVITATKTNCAAGTLTIKGARVLNPPTAGQYTIRWTNDDGQATVYIVDSDQINVTAMVDPFMTFNVGVQAVGESCDVSFNGNGGVLGFGVLNPASVASSDLAGVGHICTRLTSNGTTGAVVTVKSLNGGLKSQSKPEDVIPSVSGPTTPGTPNFGLCVSSVNGETGTGTPYNPASTVPAAAAPYDGVCSATDHSAVGALTAGVAEPLWTVADTTVDAFAKLYLKATSSATQAAHNDYFDQLTFVATSSY
jgi:sugar lactone lactonase YvrE